jgi:hypothetical protein
MRIALVAYPHTRPFLVEVLTATAKVLQSWGHDVFETPAPGSPGTALEIIFGAGFKANGIPLWPKRTDRKCVWINWDPLPQTQEHLEERRRKYALDELLEVSGRVDGILCVSHENVAVGRANAKGMGINFSFLPIGYHESFDHSDLIPPQVNDILFFGLLSDHRTTLLKKIERQFKVVKTQSIFGAERDRVIAQSKINLNLHATDHPVSFGVRVPVMFLSSGRFFISEPMKWWNPLVDGEHYVVWDGKSEDPFKRFLADDTLRRRIGQQGRDWIRGELRYEAFLKKSLEELSVL